MAKINIGKLIASMKGHAAPSSSLKGKLVNKKSGPLMTPFRERDMRQEAMDMGSHQAKELFGGMNDKSK